MCLNFNPSTLLSDSPLVNLVPPPFRSVSIKCQGTLCSTGTPVVIEMSKVVEVLVYVVNSHVLTGGEWTTRMYQCPSVYSSKIEFRVSCLLSFSPVTRISSYFIKWFYFYSKLLTCLGPISTVNIPP